jgi:hypothetical protein
MKLLNVSIVSVAKLRMGTKGFRWAIVILAAVVLALPLRPAEILAAPRLPDLIVWADAPLNYMYGGSFDRDHIKNKVLYRFTGALPNIGAGPLEVREVTHPNQMQDIYQRVHQDDLSVDEFLLGSFQKQSTPFGHLFLPGIAQYNLRMVLPGDGIGPIVSSQDKTSMALVDGNDYDTTLPNAPLDPFYDDVDDEFLGVSVGWADIYSPNLPGQWVDVTGLPDGMYWLEVIADPYNRIQEIDETNNATRIKVNLVIPDPRIIPGDYNQDGAVNAADYTVWRNSLGDSVPPAPGPMETATARLHARTSANGRSAIWMAQPEPHPPAPFPNHRVWP